jgi:hypothetical protein
MMDVNQELAIRATNIAEGKFRLGLFASVGICEEVIAHGHCGVSVDDNAGISQTGRLTRVGGQIHDPREPHQSQNTRLHQAQKGGIAARQPLVGLKSTVPSS